MFKFKYIILMAFLLLFSSNIYAGKEQEDMDLFRALNNVCTKIAETLSSKIEPIDQESQDNIFYSIQSALINLFSSNEEIKGVVSKISNNKEISNIAFHMKSALSKSYNYPDDLDGITDCSQEIKEIDSQYPVKDEIEGVLSTFKNESVKDKFKRYLPKIFIGSGISSMSLYLLYPRVEEFNNNIVANLEIASLAVTTLSGLAIVAKNRKPISSGFKVIKDTNEVIISLIKFGVTVFVIYIVIKFYVNKV